KELGWWARSGNIPLGYLDDEAKTRETFPTVNGIKYSVPGDKVRLLSDGTLELHGRESVTINSGGEKIFAEEVEQAVKHHAAVFDAVVTGRRSERWGNEVVAIVQLKEGVAATEESLLAECERHIARYKLPKAFIFLEAILRSPSGKADYRWAKDIVER
ncbi:MAG: acyl-CoA synthetase, partial [Pseudomonadota bacterium]|nr:acyl-CoA synthetase [Pseudomonadota bacterium]